MEHVDLFNASSPKGKASFFPLFELDKDGEIRLDLGNDNEVNMDNLSFTPASQGLGFHHAEKFQKTNSLVKRHKTNLKDAATAPTVILGKNSAQKNSLDSINLSQAEIALLGGQKSQEKMETLHGEIPLKTEKKQQAAGIINQGFAWFIDLACITFSLATTVALFTLLSGIHWTTIAGLLSVPELTIFLGSLFVIYYLLYFTVLDLHQTPGKSMLGVRLERLDGRRIKVKQTFMRALVSLISFVLLGLPLTMDFQGKLSDTKVVR